MPKISNVRQTWSSGADIHPAPSHCFEKAVGPSATPLLPSVSSRRGPHGVSITWSLYSYREGSQISSKGPLGSFEEVSYRPCKKSRLTKNEYLHFLLEIATHSEEDSRLEHRAALD